MAIVFTKFSDALLADQGKAVEYTESKLRQFVFQIVPESVETFAQSIRNAAEGKVYLGMAGKLPQPQLASKEACAREEELLDEKMREQLKTQKACLLKADKMAKIKSGTDGDEVVQDERFTYLEAPFHDIPKFTAALVRRTDKAEYCLIAIGYLFRPKEVREKEKSHDVIVYQAPKIVVLDLSSIVSDIAGKLADGLVGGVLGSIGALIFDAIFPPGIPSYFDEVYKQIEDIIKKQLVQNDIDVINNKINALKEWISITYTNAKNSGESKQQLTDLLKPREPDIKINMIGVLEGDPFAEVGLCVFMIGAGIHLTICQELALVDPNFSPNASPRAKDVKDYAAAYADHATKTFKSITDSRKSQIHAERDTYSPPSGTIFSNVYWFEDSLTGFKSQNWTTTVDVKGIDNPDASNRRDQAMTEYQKEKLDKLTKDMSDPIATANEWRKLVDQPIPPLLKK